MYDLTRFKCDAHGVSVSVIWPGITDWHITGTCSIDDRDLSALQVVALIPRLGARATKTPSVSEENVSLYRMRFVIGTEKIERLLTGLKNGRWKRSRSENFVRLAPASKTGALELF